jgi:hypothetical protein
MKGHGPIDLTAMRALTPRALANVKPVPDWAAIALSSHYKQLAFARKKKDSLAALNARVGLQRLRRRFGLPEPKPSTLSSLCAASLEGRKVEALAWGVPT